ncbi:hypothetical protein EVAR_21111_1 [Eumeta japonica]|uniref:Uncharacterized protein n=1 Tax=Eumeta variegata TaxID=151549 RepID=A0A4C1VW75_EUMVA|nr:hypothetical protein EVAR_21111_1 [Eumeta japonica]
MRPIFAGGTQEDTRMPPYVNLPRSSKSRNPLLGSLLLDLLRIIGNRGETLNNRDSRRNFCPKSFPAFVLRLARNPAFLLKVAIPISMRGVSRSTYRKRMVTESLFIGERKGIIVLQALLYFSISCPRFANGTVTPALNTSKLSLWLCFRTPSAILEYQKRKIMDITCPALLFAAGARAESFLRQQISMRGSVARSQPSTGTDLALEAFKFDAFDSKR